MIGAISRSRGLRFQSRSNPRQVMIAVPHGVILEKELAGEGSIGVQRDRRGAIELRIAEGTDGRGGCGAVTPKQFQRRLFCRRVVLPDVTGVDFVDDVPGY